MDAERMAEWGERLVEHGDVLREIFPGPAGTGDQALEQWVRSSADCVWHPACTCRMGNDAASVVDERLRVHGLHQLRIADASVMPTLTSANTNAPIMMIGEKASDLILATASKAVRCQKTLNLSVHNHRRCDWPICVRP